MDSEIIKLRTRFKIQGVLVAGLIVVIGWLLFFQEKPKPIIIPEIEYVEVPATIVPLPDKEIIDSVFINGDTIIIENEVNKMLLSELTKVRDSVELLHKYLDAIKINRYKGVVKQEHATATYTAVTTGTLDSISIGMILHEREIDVPKEWKPKAKLLVGASMGSSFKEFKPTFGLGAAYQTKKGDLFSLDVNLREEVYISYKTPLFK